MEMSSFYYTEHISYESGLYIERRQDMFDILFIISLIFVVIGLSVVFSLLIGRNKNNSILNSK